MTYCRTKMDNQVKWTVTEEFKILLDVLWLLKKLMR
jgi:hypothetical protein